MKAMLSILAAVMVLTSHISGQRVALERASLKPVHVSMKLIKMAGVTTVRVTKDTAVKAFDEPTFVRLDNTDFHNGVIEVSVLSRLLPNAPDFARGFIGVAFRINKDNTGFESIYLRPTNGRATQQLRRNRSVQYFSYPNYQFDRLRREAPGEYETYANIGLNEWITMKIKVKDQQALLFLNGHKQASLIVNDLKRGADSSGTIGFFVDIGTEGFFRDLKVTHHK